MEPAWIAVATLHLLHDRQLELFGGLRGIRDEGVIDSALARPRNLWEYGQSDDIEALAAAHLCALATQQGYVDGNKRAALAATLVFLTINGHTLNAPGPELYALVMAAATGDVTVEQAAAWMRRYVTPIGPTRSPAPP